MSNGIGNREPGTARRSFARSLYWRIGFGFILFLAITLILQVGLFIWVAGETEGGMPERMGRDFAELVASEFEAALARDPQLDLRAYAQRRVRSFIVRPRSFSRRHRGGARGTECLAACAFRNSAPRWRRTWRPGTGRTG